MWLNELSIGINVVKLVKILCQVMVQYLGKESGEFTFAERHTTIFNFNLKERNWELPIRIIVKG